MKIIIVMKMPYKINEQEKRQPTMSSTVICN